MNYIIKIEKEPKKFIDKQDKTTRLRIYELKNTSQNVLI